MRVFGAIPTRFAGFYLDREQGQWAGGCGLPPAISPRAAGPYAVKEAPELAKIAGTLHHGGPSSAVIGERFAPPAGAGPRSICGPSAACRCWCSTASSETRIISGALVRTAAFLRHRDGGSCPSGRSRPLPSPRRLFASPRGGMESVELMAAAGPGAFLARTRQAPSPRRRVAQGKESPPS